MKCMKLMFFALLFFGLSMASAAYVHAQNYNISLSGIFPNGVVATASGLFPGSGTKDLGLLAGGVCTGITDNDGICNWEVLPVTGAFVCQNGGGNFGWGTTTGPVAVDLSGLKDITQAVKNGRFRGQTITATVDSSTPDDLCAQWGNNWQLYDFAFCGDNAFQVTGNLQVDDSSVTSQTVVCNIPGDINYKYSCDQLSAVKKQGIFNGPVYTCRVCTDGNCSACLAEPSSCPLL